MQMNSDSENQVLEGLEHTTNTTPHSEGCLVSLIRARAYELFEECGGYPGHELDVWFQTEREIQHHLGL